MMAQRYYLTVGTEMANTQHLNLEIGCLSVSKENGLRRIVRETHGVSETTGHFLPVGKVRQYVCTHFIRIQNFSEDACNVYYKDVDEVNCSSNNTTHFYRF